MTNESDSSGTGKFTKTAESAPNPVDERPPPTLVPLPNRPAASFDRGPNGSSGMAPAVGFMASVSLTASPQKPLLASHASEPLPPAAGSGHSHPDPPTQAATVSQIGGMNRWLGRRLGNLVIVSQIGRGAMGTVYRAENTVLRRPVAVKVLSSNLAEDPIQTERFLSEARLAARVNHPNVVNVFDFGTVDDRAYIVMELVEGISAADRIARDGPMPWAEAAMVTAEACRALMAAHAEGLIHRDIKPANLLLTRQGQAKLTDFGLAKSLGNDSALTTAGFAMGTPQFMSPEQARAERLDPRTDIYSLGATLYALLAGHSPFPHDSVLMAMKAHCDEPLPDITALNPQVPPALAGVISRAMAKARDDRYPTVAEMLVDLETLLGEFSQEAKPMGDPRTSSSGQAAASASRFRSPTPDAGSPHAGSPRISSAPKAVVSQPASPVADGPAVASVKSASLSAASRAMPPADQLSPAGPTGITRRQMFVWVGAGAAAVTALGVGGLAALRGIADRWKMAGPDASPVDGNTPRVTPPPGLSPSAEPIKVGILHSLSGTMSQSESPVVEATQLAIKLLNRQGGLLGRPIVPIVADGRSHWPTFAAEAERLITAEKVSVIFGCWTSASRKTVKPLFEKWNHLLFYPVQYEGLETSPNIVYTGAAPNQQILPAVQWAYGKLGKRFFLVGSDYVFPRTAHEIIKDEIARLGGTLTGEAFLPLGSTDTKPVVQTIVQAKPEVILNTINGDTNTSFFRELRAAGITAKTTPTISFSITDIELSSVDPAAVAGHYAAWNYFPFIDTPENKAFVAAFREEFGPLRITNDPMEAAYIGVNLWAEAVRLVGKADPQSVLGVIRTPPGLSFNAPEGRVELNPYVQHLSKRVAIGQANMDGRFIEEWGSAKAVPPEPFPRSRTMAQWNEFLDQLYRGWGGQWSAPAV